MPDMSFHLNDGPLVEDTFNNPRPRTPPRPDATAFAFNLKSPAKPSNAVVSISHLFLNDRQRQIITEIYKKKLEFRCTYLTSNASQNQAQAILDEHELDKKSLDRLESRWGTSWSNTWGKGAGIKKRVLYQCTCGYNTNARQKRSESKNKSSNDWTRHAAYDFTECCAHVDITYVVATGFIERIIGSFDHNDSCKNGLLMRYPAIPLHPHVYEVALAQLAQGASVASIQSENVRRCEQKLYRGQKEMIPELANHRYQLLRGDFSRLYRRHYSDQGINIDIDPEYNVDNWLNSSHANYNPTIAEAVFHYSARAEKGERFELCIATPEMIEAGWKYVHNKQLILDGTFGLCTSRLLLWIAMGVDENNHGIPIAMFLFSAPTGAKATHAGYDTKILTKLLQECKAAFGEKDGRSFAPAVAITDTDTKERGALIKVWPAIKLLLCKFHLRQCWTNKRAASIGRRENSYYKNHVINILKSFEERMLLTTNYEEALGILCREEKKLEELHRTPVSQGPGNDGLLYMKYFRSTWMSLDLWESWSRKGRNDAATILGIEIDGVLPTTNHLESFNGVLKRKYIKQWQRSGRRLRFDVLIHRLIQSILPNIFAHHRMTDTFTLWRSDRFREAAGGARLIPSSRKKALEPVFIAIAWFEPDPLRDGPASDLAKMGRIVPIQNKRMYELWATCAATGADMRDTQYGRYWLTAHPSGAATCTCMDWMKRGGACKHLRAFRIVIEHWMKNSMLDFIFAFHPTREDALRSDEQNRRWYGNDYVNAITQSSDPAIVTKPLSVPPETINIKLLPVSLLPINQPLPIPTIEQEADLAHEFSILEQTNKSSDPETPLDLKNLQVGSNSRAIETQIQQRFEHYIQQTLPILHGMNTLLDDTFPLPTTTNLNEFEQTLAELVQKLSHSSLDSCSDLELEADLPAAIPDISLSKTTSNASLKRTAQALLLPPSPEARAGKRKKSYSVL